MAGQVSALSKAKEGLQSALKAQKSQTRQSEQTAADLRRQCTELQSQLTQQRQEWDATQQSLERRLASKEKALQVLTGHPAFVQSLSGWLFGVLDANHLTQQTTMHCCAQKWSVPCVSESRGDVLCRNMLPLVPGVLLPGRLFKWSAACMAGPAC